MSRVDKLLRLAAPFIRPVYGGAGVILMFHRVLLPDVRPRIAGHSALEVTPAALEQTIAYFSKNNYVVFSPDDLYQFLIGAKKADKPFILFTFDDGYVDNLTVAYPIFERHNIPFTINISTGFPDRTAVIWWYLLEDLILARERITFEVDGHVYDFACASPEDKSLAYARLRRLFKFANKAQRDILVAAAFHTNRVDLVRKVDEVALTWAQLKQLAADPLVTLSAHTANHYVLSVLTEAEARFEIAESKRVLEMQLERAINHFAYPFGNRREAGEREFRLAGEAGFKTALTTRFGSIFPEHGDNLMALPRYDLVQLSLPRDLELVASGALSMRVNRLQRVITE